MDTILATNTLRLVRVFDAPRERVFAAWTDPDQFMQWMCPPGFGLDRCAFDVRPGGAWEAHGYKPGNERFTKTGVYLEVRPPERLVFTWTHPDASYGSMRGHETTVELTFRAIGSKTELTLVHGPFPDRPNLDGHHAGWLGCFDKLDTFLR